jgi:DNA-binding transcriptional MerR regulator
MPQKNRSAGRWEAKGYIPESERVVSGHRAYRRFNLEQVEMISGIKAFFLISV